MTDRSLVDNMLSRSDSASNNSNSAGKDIDPSASHNSKETSTQRASARISTPSASISAITPDLYVGTLLASKDEALLTSLGITHICSCIGGEPLFPDRFDYLMLNFNDRVTTDLNEPAQVLANYFNTNNDESKLMIYCGAGMSRSPALAIAWLIKVKKMSFEDACKLVRIGRGPRFVRVNDGFMRQLREM